MSGSQNLSNLNGKRIAWAITGAGHFLSQCVDFIDILSENMAVDVYISLAGIEVLGMYTLLDKLEYSSCNPIREAGHSFPSTGKFAGGSYAGLIIAPATGNSVAKFVYGIADTLTSSLFAQAGKSRIPICVLPTDTAAEMTSVAPSGKVIKVYPRPVDLMNTEKLSSMDGVSVVYEPKEIASWLKNLKI